MHALPAFLLFWGLLPGSGATCTTAYGDKIRYCKTFQTDYIEGIEILIFEERDVGRINSTVFSSPNLKSVLSLTLKGSKIHTIDSGAFAQFQGLSNIELQDNSLTSLSPSWFHDPTTLKNLTVASNSIGQLRPEMLEGFTNLERLNLSRNQITSIHSESFWSSSKMASLDLSYNRISSLQWQALSPLNGTLRLGGNPWNCSCAHKDFILFLKEMMNASRLADPTSVTCRYPPDLMGALVWNVSEMNCSSPAPPPAPAAVFHKVVLPVLFVVFGGLFFSMSLWLIICILTRRCKNKVTNMTDPECPAHQSRENCAELHHHLKGRLVSPILEERLAGSLHPGPETIAGIRSTLKTVSPPHHGSQKGKDLGRFFHSDLRASKSEPRALSGGVNAPVVFNAFAFKMSGEIVFGTCQTSVKEHSAAELYKRDPINPPAANHTGNMQNVEAAGRSVQHGGKQRCNSENETREYGNPDGDLSGETGLETYYEAHINPTTNPKNVSNAGESKTEGNGHDISSNNATPFTFGKKCKTWSTFCFPQDKDITSPSESLDRREIRALPGRGDVKEEPVEGVEETSCTNQDDHQGEGGSESLGIDPMDLGPGLAGEGLHKDVTGGQNLLDSRAEDGPCRRQEQGPSRRNKTTNSKERRSLPQERLTREKLWKYHKNCCDEFAPCQTASNNLRQLEKREQEAEEVKREPPCDDDLLEEGPSLPLLLPKPSECQMLMNPAISPKKSCVSLPNLGVYGNHNPSSISANSPSTESLVVQDETGTENASKDALVCKTDLPIIDLPAESIASYERLGDVSLPKTNLPIVDVPSEGLIKAGRGLYDVSGTGSDSAPRNCARGRNSVEQDGVLQDLVNCHHSQSLPDINALYGGMSREDGMSQAVPSSNLELPAINLRTEHPLRNEIGYNKSSNALHLPIINASSGDDTEENPSQDHSPGNLEIPAQSVVRDEKFSVVSPGLPDVLPSGDVQSEGLVINGHNPNNILQCLPFVSEPPEGKMLGRCKTGKHKGDPKVRTKSCPVLFAMLDMENQDGNPNYNQETLNCGQPGTKTGSVVSDSRNSTMAQSNTPAFVTSLDVSSIPVKTMTTRRQESPLSNKEWERSNGDISDITPGTDTHLTPSASYSISIQDGDEISEWPNTVDILKQSSTISLSSKYDILDSSAVPQGEEENVISAMKDNGHRVDVSTCRTDSLSNTSVLQQDDREAEDKKASSPREKNMSENTLHTCSTSKEERMTEDQRPPHSYTVDMAAMSDPTALLPTSELDKIQTFDKSEECRKEISATTSAHDLLEDVDCQREDPNEHEDPSDNVTSSLHTKVQCSQLEAPGSEDKMMEKQENIGEEQVMDDVGHEDALTERCTSHVEVSHTSHVDVNPSDDGNTCKSADTLTCSQQRAKNHPQDDEDRMKERHNSDSEERSSLCSSSKDVTNKFRKPIGAQKLEASKTFKTDHNIAPCTQDLKDYISVRLLRRPFQSVFPISVKSPCPEDGNNSLEEQAFDKHTPPTLSDTLSHTNDPEESSKKMTDAIEYLTYLYARSPGLKISHVPDKDEKTIDDIRVLANLQFCKVSGGFIADAEIPETVHEAAEDPKLVSSRPDNLYIPPSKEELKADDELAFLNVMYTLKKSLELSASYDPDDRTDT